MAYGVVLTQGAKSKAFLAIDVGSAGRRRVENVSDILSS